MRFLFLCGEGEFSFAVRAVQILVCAPPARRLLRSLALRGVGEWWRLILASLREGGGPRRDSPKRACRVLGVLALAVEGERVQNKISANFKVSQAPSVKCSAFATSLSEGGSCYNRTIPLSVILSGGEAEVEVLERE